MREQKRNADFLRFSLSNSLSFFLSLFLFYVSNLPSYNSISLSLSLSLFLSLSLSLIICLESSVTFPFHSTLLHLQKTHLSTPIFASIVRLATLSHFNFDCTDPLSLLLRRFLCYDHLSMNTISVSAVSASKLGFVCSGKEKKIHIYNRTIKEQDLPGCSRI